MGYSYKRRGIKDLSPAVSSVLMQHASLREGGMAPTFFAELCVIG